MEKGLFGEKGRKGENYMKRFASVCIATAASVLLLCGFAPAPERYETTEPVTTVQVKSLSGAVTVQGAETDRVTVEGSASFQEDYDITVQEGVLTIADKKIPQQKEPVNMRINLSEGTVTVIEKEASQQEGAPAAVSAVEKTSKIAKPHRSSSVTVTLPQKQYEALKIASIIGPVTLRDASANKVAAASITGNVKLENVQAGELEMGSITGALYAADSSAKSLEGGNILRRIRLDRVSANRIELGSQIGRIDLNQVATDECRCASVLGSIRGRFLGDRADYLVDARGFFDLFISDVPPCTKSIKFSTMFGGVSVNFEN